MTKGTEFSKKTETATLKILTAIGRKMSVVQENLFMLEGSRARGKFKDYHARELLLQYAELARLQQAVNRVIRDHKVKCPGCSYEAPLSDYRLIYAGASGENAVIQCDRSYGKGRLAEEECRMLLNSKEWQSTKELLRYAFVPLEEIFGSP